MRHLAVAAVLVCVLAGLSRADSTTAPATPTTTIHVDLTAAVGNTVAGKITAGDKCTVTVTLVKNVYTASIHDTNANVTAKGTLEETADIGAADLKKLAKVVWTVAGGDTGHGKDIVILTTTETIPKK